ncbi:MAG: PqiC family protein [Burkholderiaceae bacterium]|jgi:cholesterol transport system auxiliary component|nr:PqiC family protein [Burkholderiaceae bacterium]
MKTTATATATAAAALRARFIPFISLTAACLLAAGCALPMPDKPQRPAPYDLGLFEADAAAAAAAATDAAPSQAAQRQAAVALAWVESPAALQGTAMLYRLAYADGARQPRPYALARWSMPPAQMLGQRLRQHLAQSRPVVGVGENLAPIELRLELDEFSQLFGAEAQSEGIVRLRATAIAPQARGSARLLGQRTFEARQPAATSDAAGGARALSEASNRLVREIAGWIDQVAATTATTVPAPR